MYILIKPNAFTPRHFELTTYYHLGWLFIHLFFYFLFQLKLIFKHEGLCIYGLSSTAFPPRSIYNTWRCAGRMIVSWWFVVLCRGQFCCWQTFGLARLLCWWVDDVGNVHGNMPCLWRSFDGDTVITLGNFMAISHQSMRLNLCLRQ